MTESVVAVTPSRAVNDVATRDNQLGLITDAAVRRQRRCGYIQFASSSACLDVQQALSPVIRRRLETMTDDRRALLP